MTNLQKIDSEPEESFESAAVHTRNQTCPTWLGISRDIRIFEIGTPEDMERIIPRNASSTMRLPETNHTNVSYGYMIGRGVGVENNSVRRLEDGFLPILHNTLKDGDIEYNSTSFVTTECSGLTEIIRFGTHFLVADKSSYGHMFTPAQESVVESLLKEDSLKTEETVLYYRAVAKNRSAVPRYAWFRTLRPGAGWWDKLNYRFDPETGFSGYSSGRIFGISRLNGKPLQNEEIAILLKPEEEAVFEFRLPHKPISEERALKLSLLSFDEKLAECKNFWNAKLQKAASIKLPEKRIRGND